MNRHFFDRRLGAAERDQLLTRVIESVREGQHAHAPPPVCAFDLDGTLMDNRPRVVAILHELAEAWRLAHPGEAEACARAIPEDIGYGFVENMKRLGVHDPALHEAGLTFWRERFFTDDYQRHDVAIPGAVSFVRACHDAGAIVVYLTGRDLPNMALGSFRSLRFLGFPIGEVGTELVVKPLFEIPDAEFKRTTAPKLGRLGRVVAAFDNEAANVNVFYEAYPECVGVFVDSQYAPDPPLLDPRASVIDHFERTTP